jgi:hypothetical protein
MKITDEQLDSYIALYKSEYGEELERTRGLNQLLNLLYLVLHLAFPKNTVQEVEEIFEKEYTKDATHDE